MAQIAFLCLSEDWGQPGFENVIEIQGKVVPSRDLEVSKLNTTAKQFWKEIKTTFKSLALREKVNQGLYPIEFFHEGSNSLLKAFVLEDDSWSNKQKHFGRYIMDEDNYVRDASRYRAVMFVYEFDNVTPYDLLQIIKNKNTTLPDRISIYNEQYGVETLIKTIPQQELITNQEKHSEASKVEPSATMSVSSQQLPIATVPEGNLFSEIDKSIVEIISYGNELEQAGEAKGKILIDLGNSINEQTQAFKANLALDSPTQSINKFIAYQTAVMDMIEKRRLEFTKFRSSGASWQSIVINLVLAISGVGTLILAGKLIHSKMTEGNARFFSVKDFDFSTENSAKTTSAAKVNALKKRFPSNK